MARVTLKVHPRARRTRIAGKLGDAWKLDLSAPPVEGKANEECIRFIADLAGVPRGSVRIVSGATSRMKLIEVEGVSQDALDRLLETGAAPR